MESLVGTASQPEVGPALRAVPNDWEHDVHRRLAAGDDVRDL
jgi:hypothetical protein